MINKTQTLVLSDIWPKPQARTQTIIRNATLVVGFALLTAICAQIRIPLGFTPVPITGQTFAVLLLVLHSAQNLVLLVKLHIGLPV